MVAWLVSMPVVAPDATGTWAVDLEPDFSGHASTVTCTLGRTAEAPRGIAKTTRQSAGRLTVDACVGPFKTGENGEFIATFSATIADRNQTMTGLGSS
jgi:hypothetical protein